MLVFLTTARHQYTLTRWIKARGDELPGNIRVLSYDQLWGRVPFATYVFTDLERLSEKRIYAAHRVWQRLRDAGLRVLNRPGTSMCRYDLQKALANDFDVYRSSDDLGSVRYPVFLRDENDHSGNLTPLLQTRAELEEARLRLPQAMIVEFLDTADAKGIYRKYSYYRVGDRLFPGHVDFSTSWMVKDSSMGISVSECLREHQDFVANSPHEEEVAEIFQRAEIDYGRIDYSVTAEGLQVWEINTNPTLSAKPLAEETELPEVTRNIIDAVIALNSADDRVGSVRLNRWLPWFGSP